MKFTAAEHADWTSYLNKWIFKGRCPVCCHSLNWRHTAARIGACNFNGPSLSNGFLEQVKNRKWQEVIEPFSRLTSMDMMACEILHCPRGLALLVWVEIDLVMGGDQYLAYFERVNEYERSQIEQVTSLTWVRF